VNAKGDVHEEHMGVGPASNTRSSRDSAVSDYLCHLLWMAICDITGPGIMWGFVSIQPDIPLPKSGATFLRLVCWGYRDELSFGVTDFSEIYRQIRCSRTQLSGDPIA